MADGSEPLEGFREGGMACGPWPLLSWARPWTPHTP